MNLDIECPLITKVSCSRTWKALPVPSVASVQCNSWPRDGSRELAPASDGVEKPYLRSPDMVITKVLMWHTASMPVRRSKSASVCALGS